MGRTKAYERDELIAAALELFHAHGFTGTSTQMLVDHLEVNRNTMYAEFGSKQGLFDAALRRYEQLVATDVFGALEGEGAGLDTITEVFERFVADAPGAAGLGCLLCNTAVELGGADPSRERFVPRYLERVHAAFLNALKNAQRAGELTPELAPGDEARFLTTAALGIFVLVRARAAPAAIQGAARAAKRHVERLRSAGG